MKAVRVHQFGGPEVLRLEEIPDPKPGPGQVCVQIKAAGVNPVDTYVRSGTYAHRPDLPYIPGLDAAGVVLAAGEGVERFSAGDRVYLAGAPCGTYAQQVCCPESRVHPLPERISFAQGAAVGIPYATAYRALFQRGGAQPGETVLVHGASGAVGVAALQLCRAAGMAVIGTAGSERGRQLAARQGARHVLDHHRPDYLQELLELTSGGGVDLILEMLANVNLARDLTVLAPRGRVVIIGSRGPVEINPRDAMLRDAQILGMVLFNASQDQLRRIHSALVAGLETGILSPVVGREMPLARAAEAHQAVLEAGAYGKIVLLP